MTSVETDPGATILRMARGVVRAVARGHRDAEDLAQDAALGAVSALRRARGGSPPPRRFLEARARGAVLDALRGRRLRGFRDRRRPGGPPPPVLEARDAFDDLADRRGGLEVLEARDAVRVLVRVVEAEDPEAATAVRDALRGLTTDETAARDGIGVPRAQRRMRRARTIAAAAAGRILG